jgi:hypothetical protein
MNKKTVIRISIGLHLLVLLRAKIDVKIYRERSVTATLNQHPG